MSSFLRWSGLVALVGAILVGSSYINTDTIAFVADLAYAQGAPTSVVLATDTSVPLTTATVAPTPTDSATPSSSATATTPPDGTPLPTQTPYAPPSPTPIAIGTVDAGGGTISSADGAVSVTFPSGATSEPLQVTITPRILGENGPPSPSDRWLALWDFDAVALNRANAPVHQFASSVTVDLRFTTEQLADRNRDSIKFWTFDETAGNWVVLPSTFDPPSGHLSVAVGHFSPEGPTASNLVDVGPLLDGLETNPHTGASTLQIPIQLPTGRGGLAPSLSLDYDSSRLGDMRQYDSTSSWVGQGWELGTGSIFVGQQPAFGDIPMSLEMSGLGGKIDSTTAGYRLETDPYTLISGACTAGPCTVTTKNGTQYVFGLNDQTRRWYYYTYYDFYGNPLVGRAFYRLDLAYTRDLLGNEVDYVYDQHLSASCLYPCNSAVAGTAPCGVGYCDVQSAYLHYIRYNFTGASPGVEVRFDTSCDDNSLAPAQTCRRYDSPRSGTYSGCPTYVAPRIIETHRLDSISVSVAGQLQRKYNLAYNVPSDGPYAFYYAPAPGTPCPATEGHAGNLRLTSFAVRDDTDSSTLSTMTFQYAAKDMHFLSHAAGVPDHLFTYSWPLLTQATNSFGGSVAFVYAEKGSQTSPNRWTREAVTKETNDPGGGQPPIVTDFNYCKTAACSGAQDDWPDEWNNFAAGDSLSSTFSGFRRVTATVNGSDPIAANRVVTEHNYFTNDGWGANVRAGREYRTVVRDGAGAVWQQSATQWVVRPFGTPTIFPTGPISLRYLVNFVYAGETTHYLKDGTEASTVQTYDSNGNLTRTVSYANHIAMDATLTTYVSNTSAGNWLFLPNHAEKRDLRNHNCLLSSSSMYYDGASGSTAITATPTKGLLTTTAGTIETTDVTLNPCTQDAGNVTSYAYSAYDAYGNVVAGSVPTSISPESLPQHMTLSPAPAYGWLPASVDKTLTEYDPTQRTLAVKQTDVLGHIARTSYDSVWLKPVSVSGPMITDNDPTAHTVQTSYDTFGRIVAAWDNYDSSALPTQSFSYFWGGAPNITMVTRRTVSGSSSTSTLTSCTDGFGRTTAQKQPYNGTSQNSTRVDYNARGFKSVQTNAFNVTGQIPVCGNEAVTNYDRATYAYDPLGNAIQTTYIPGGQTTGTFPQISATSNGSTSTTTDELGHTTTKTVNPVLRTASVLDPGSASTGTGGTTLYTYDALHRLIDVKDALQNETTVAYDTGGRKTAMHDPDMGNWTYGYDLAGKLTTQTDAKATTTHLEYDAAERLTHKSYTQSGSAFDQDIHFYYDAYDSGYCSTSPWAQPAIGAVGRMTKMTDGSGQQQSCFDLRGREVASRRITDNNTYDVDRSFDNLGQAISLTYPSDGQSRETVTLTEDSLGEITQAASSYGETIFSGVTRNPTGSIGAVSLGTSPLLSTSYNYDSRARLTQIQTGSVQTEILKYDDASNVTCVADNTSNPNCSDSGPGEVTRYTYDELNRLTGMKINGATAATYKYNQIGNMTTKAESFPGMLNNSDFSSIGGDGLVYPASGANSVRPHAVTSSVGSQQLAIGYDANGNLAMQGTDTYTYDAENHIKTRTVGNQTVTYTYDGGGNQLKRVNGDGTSTVYVGGAFERNFSAQGTATGTTKYYSGMGRPVAYRTTGASGGAGTLQWMLTDHLGSTSGIVNASGTLVSSAKYWPYGAVRASSGTLGTDKMFTGQRQEATPADSALGLDNYHARFYSTTIGSFVSADTIANDGLNRYSYVRGNPMTGTDPSGMSAVIICGVQDACAGRPCVDFGNQTLCHRQSISFMKAWVIQYWRQHEHIFGDYGYENAFEMLETVLKLGWSADQTLAAFHIGFIDTARHGLAEGVVDLIRGVGGYESDFWNLRHRLLGSGGAEIDTLIGYSEGGAVAADVLADSGARGYRPESAVLIQPAISYYPTALRASDAPWTRIVTVNSSSWHAAVGGTISGAMDVSTGDCGGPINHCSNEDIAGFALWAAGQPLGASGDVYITERARLMGIDVCKSPCGIQPEPVPPAGG